MHQKHQKAAIIASMMSGFIIALFYHFELIVASKTMMIISMLLLSLAWLYFSYCSGKTQWIITFLLIWIIGCTIEWIGIATCRPYGCFQYSDLLWPKFLETFPYLLMWVRPFIVISIGISFQKTNMTTICCHYELFYYFFSRSCTRSSTYSSNEYGHINRQIEIDLVCHYKTFFDGLLPVDWVCDSSNKEKTQLLMKHGIILV